MLNISFLVCTKVESCDLTVCIAVNVEKFQSRTVTLTLVPQCHYRTIIHWLYLHQRKRVTFSLQTFPPSPLDPVHLVRLF